MADDTIISIGAVIDLSQILPGLQELIDQTQAATEQMQASLESLSTTPVIPGALVEPTVTPGVAVPETTAVAPEEAAIAEEAKPAVDALSQSIDALKLKVQELNELMSESAGVASLAEQVGLALEAEQQLELQGQALIQVTETLAAAQDILFNAISNSSEAVSESVASSEEAAAAADTLAKSYDQLTAASERAITASGELKAAKESELGVLESSEVLTATAVSRNVAVEKEVSTSAEATAANEELSTSTVMVAAGEQLAADAFIMTGDAAQIEASLLQNSVDVMTERISTAGEVTAAAASQAVAEQAAGDAAATGASLTGASTKVIAENAVAMMAQGNTAQETAEKLVASGASAQSVVTAFNSLKISITEANGQLNVSQTAAAQTATSLRSAGAAASQVAAELRLFGLSGREIVAEMLKLGFSVNESIAALKQMGIAVNSAGNETLRLAVTAGATRDELENLAASMGDVSNQAAVMTNRMGVARIGMGLFDGSTGMVAGGLARVAAASKFLAPLLTTLFPVILALGFIDILTSMYEKLQKITDAIEGNTDAVKKFNEENIKASESAEVQASTVSEAQKKIQENIRIIGEISQETWSVRAAKGIEVADKTTAAWQKIIPVWSFINELAIIIGGSMNGIEGAANTLVKTTRNNIELQEKLLNLESARFKEQSHVVEGETSIAKVGSTRVEQIKEEISALSKRVELEVSAAKAKAGAEAVKSGGDQGIAKVEAERKIREEFGLKSQELTKQQGVAELEESISVAKAIADGEKTVGLARLAQKQKLAQELYEVGKSTLEQEKSDLEKVENDKYEIEKANLEKRRVEAERSRGTGKDPTAVLRTISAEETALETTHQTTVSTIQFTGQQERLKLDAEYNRTLIEGARGVAEAREANLKEAWRVQFEEGKISEEKYTELLKTSEDQRYEQEHAALIKRVQEAQSSGTLDEQRKNVTEAYLKIEELDERHQGKLDAIDVSSQKRRNEEEKKLITQSIEDMTKRAEEAVRITERESAENIRLIDAEANFYLLTAEQKAALDAQEIDREHAKARAILETALAREQDMRMAAQASAAQEAADKKIADLKRQLSKLDDDYAAHAKKVWEDLTIYEIQQAQKAYTVINGAFTSAVDKMLTEHTKFMTVMEQFWQKMVIGWAEMGIKILANYIENLAQIVVQELLTALKINAVHTSTITLKKATENLFNEFLSLLGIKQVAQTTTQETGKTAATTTGVAARTAAETGGQGTVAAATIATNVIQVTSDAGTAGAAAFASVMEALPFPANVAAAPAVMAAVIGAVLGNLALASAAGGMEVSKDQLVQVHKNETILPSNLSLGFKNIIDTGGFKEPNVPEALTAPAAAPTGTTAAPVTNNKTQNHQWNITLNGAKGDLKTMLDDELVPRIRRAMRTGDLGL